MNSTATKLLALILVLFLLTLAACSDETEPNDETEATQVMETLPRSEPTPEELTEPTTEEPTEPTTEEPTEPTTEAPTEPTTEEPTEPTEPTTEASTEAPTVPAAPSVPATSALPSTTAAPYTSTAPAASAVNIEVIPISMAGSHPSFSITDSRARDAIFGWLDTMVPCAPDPHTGGNLFELNVTQNGVTEKYSLLSTTSDAGESYVTIGSQWHTADHELWETVVAYYPRFDSENYPPAYTLSVNYTDPVTGPHGVAFAYYADPALVWSQEEQDFATGIFAYLNGMVESPVMADESGQSVELYIYEQGTNTEKKYLCYKETDERGYPIVQYLGARPRQQGTVSGEYMGGRWFIADATFYNYLMSHMQTQTDPVSAEPAQSEVYIELGRNTISLGEINDSFRLPYTIHNGSDAERFTGQEYSIEKYDGQTWAQFPFAMYNSSGQALAWIDLGYIIPANGSADFSMFVWAFEQNMTPGEYRIVQRVLEQGSQESFLYANFTVTE
jgi:hypothetical protein